MLFILSGSSFLILVLPYYGSYIQINAQINKIIFFLSAIVKRVNAHIKSLTNYYSE